MTPAESSASGEAVGRPTASRRKGGGRLLLLGLAVVAFGVLAWSGRRRAAELRELRLAGPIFGTTWSLLARNPCGLDAERVRRAVGAVLEEVDAAASHWRADSELSALERDLGAWVRDRGSQLPAVGATPEGAPGASGILQQILVEADRLVRSTHGAFDPTVGPLVALWGFGPGASSVEPGQDALAAARARVGWLRLGFDGARFSPQAGWTAAPELDLSAIAKGAGVDAAAGALLELGLEDFLVEVGGEVRVAGERPGAGPPALRPWRVGIEAPSVAPDAAREAWLAIEPGDAAIATSGDYRAWREADGERIAHVIDPRSGRPVPPGVASVTVVDRAAGAWPCARADGLATALLVLEVAEGLALVESLSDVEALWILTDESRTRFDTQQSSGFEALLAAGAGAAPE